MLPQGLGAGWGMVGTKGESRFRKTKNQKHWDLTPAGVRDGVWVPQVLAGSQWLEVELVFAKADGSGRPSPCAPHLPSIEWFKGSSSNWLALVGKPSQGCQGSECEPDS